MKDDCLLFCFSIDFYFLFNSGNEMKKKQKKMHKIISNPKGNDNILDFCFATIHKYVYFFSLSLSLFSFTILIKFKNS